MKRSDYPRTYRQAGQVSRAKQKLYRRLVATNLMLLAAAATLTVVAAVVTRIERPLVGAAAAAVLAAVVVWLVLGIGRLDGEWFDARSIAESIKTMCWRYVMKAEPYGPELSDGQADALFLEEVQQVLQQKPAVSSQFECPGGEVEITDRMKQIRADSPAERLNAYLTGRVRDQKAWYSSRSKTSRRGARVWFWLAFALQLSALIAAVITVLSGARDFSGLLVTIAALVMTWLQVRQLSYLAHSYGTAAQEFAVIESKAPSVVTDKTLAEYVEQAELAASREHTLWVARNAL